MRWDEHDARSFNRFSASIRYDLSLSLDNYDQLFSVFGRVFSDFFVWFQYHIT
jgi:hypothetical protein